MTPLEMIAEWRKGCSNAGPVHSKCFPDGEPLKTGYCVECTEALIDALESKIREQQAEPVAVLRFASKVPGNENEMPVVLSCNWQPDGEYRVFLAPCTTEPGDAEVRKAVAQPMPIKRLIEAIDDRPEVLRGYDNWSVTLSSDDWESIRALLATPSGRAQGEENFYADLYARGCGLIGRLRTALQPFAGIKADDGDDFSSYPDEVIIRVETTAGDIKAAREAMEDTVLVLPAAPPAQDQTKGDEA